MDVNYNIKNSITRKQRLITVGVALILTAVIGLAYAWVTHSIIGESQNMLLTSASISFNYRGTSPTILAHLAPGETVEKTFEVTNNGNDSISYNLVWENVINTFDPKSDLIYSISERTLGELVSPRVAPSSNLDVYYGLTLAPGETHYLSLTLTFVLDETRDQSANIGNYFSGDISVSQGNRNMNDYINLYLYNEPIDTVPNSEHYALNERRSWCTDGTTVSYNTTTSQLEYTNLTPSTNCNVYFELAEEIKEYGYTGSEKVYPVLATGNYLLEVWGAEGGSGCADIYGGTSVGGKGGYSTGIITLSRGSTLHVHVGRTSYNGSGSAGNYNNSGGFVTSYGSYAVGGGATHIATSSGTLPTLSTNLDAILIVAGGGGGCSNSYWDHTYATNFQSFAYNGGNGNILGTGNGVIGQGTNQRGGGGGYYGGGPGVGGTGFINPIDDNNEMRLSEAYMFCLGCTESSETSTYTVNTTGTSDLRNTVTCSSGYSASPIERCAKTGSGYARITYLEERNEKEYLLTVDLDGGTQSKDYNGEYYEGKTYQIEAPIKEGYRFIDWTIEGIGATIDNNGLLKVGVSNMKLTARWVIFIQETFDFVTPSGVAQTYPVPATGTYQIETWGAQGGNNSLGGRGGYTSGIIHLEKNELLNVYVGGGGIFTSPTTDSVKYTGGYNGGGQAISQSCCGRIWGSGGGATDIRYGSTSLNDRIMSASGGGGCYYQSDTSTYCDNGGSGGGLVSANGVNQSHSGYAPGRGATQLTGGPAFADINRTSSIGTFGIGGAQTSGAGSAGGGGGYYGGGGSGHVASAAGGSSYISGHIGCVAIAEGSANEPRTTRTDSAGTLCSSSSSSGYNASGYNTDVVCSEHYSGKVFTETLMIDGSGQKWEIVNGVLVKTAEAMPNPNGGYYALNTGHTGNGYARITYLGN